MAVDKTQNQVSSLKKKTLENNMKRRRLRTHVLNLPSLIQLFQVMCTRGQGHGCHSQRFVKFPDFPRTLS